VNLLLFLLVLLKRHVPYLCPLFPMKIKTNKIIVIIILIVKLNINNFYNFIVNNFYLFCT